MCWTILIFLLHQFCRWTKFNRHRVSFVASAEPHHLQEMLQETTLHKMKEPPSSRCCVPAAPNVQMTVVAYALSPHILNTATGI